MPFHVSRFSDSQSDQDSRLPFENAAHTSGLSLNRDLESSAPLVPLKVSMGTWNPLMRKRRPHGASSLNQMSLPQSPDSPPLSPSQSLLSSANHNSHPHNTSNRAPLKFRRLSRHRLSFSDEKRVSLSPSPSPLLRPKSPASRFSARAQSTDQHINTAASTVATIASTSLISEPTPFTSKTQSKQYSELRLYDNGDLDVDVDEYSIVDSDVCAYDSDDLMSVTSRRPSLLAFPFGTSKETVASNPNQSQQQHSPFLLSQASLHFRSLSPSPFQPSDSHSTLSSSLGSFGALVTSFGTKFSRSTNCLSNSSIMPPNADKISPYSSSNSVIKQTSHLNHDVNISSLRHVGHVHNHMTPDHESISGTVSGSDKSANNTVIISDSLENTLGNLKNDLDFDTQRVSIKRVVANRNALKPKAKSFLRVSRDLQNELYPADYEMRNEARITHALALREDSIDEPVCFGHRGLFLSLDDDSLSQVPGSRTVSRSGSIVSCATSLTPTNTNGSTLTSTQNYDLPSPQPKHLDYRIQSESSDIEKSPDPNSLHFRNKHNQQSHHPEKFWSVLPFSKNIKQQKQSSILHFPSSSSNSFDTNDNNKNMPATPSPSSMATSTHLVSLCSPELSDPEDSYEADPDTHTSLNNDARGLSKVYKTLFKFSSSSHMSLKSQAPTPPKKSKRKAPLFDETTVSPFDHLYVKRRAVSPGTP
ncbi:uncharacterized protein SAPINGB_P001775 [Magnusiomyces paraingens]|uniref:Uncharacterized protein n=1 Tax=Magnusiomyces paraingens TaxID=2606893 RepID=A0A5E8BI66_9ASCO|nr:uncharacterized protein SAPINGB_P001775 [Saprochaete ingens]VVT48430.1 unnamed protein product [Saprochaete ingens]